MPADYLIEIECEKGHKQVLQVVGELGSEWAENYAGLLDGTSPWYRFPPGDDSVIGKCGICGSKIHCEVTEGH